MTGGKRELLAATREKDGWGREAGRGKQVEAGQVGKKLAKYTEKLPKEENYATILRFLLQKLPKHDGIWLAKGKKRCRNTS